MVPKVGLAAAENEQLIPAFFIADARAPVQRAGLGGHVNLLAPDPEVAARPLLRVVLRRLGEEVVLPLHLVVLLRRRVHRDAVELVGGGAEALLRPYPHDLGPGRVDDVVEALFFGVCSVALTAYRTDLGTTRIPFLNRRPRSNSWKNG